MQPVANKLTLKFHDNLNPIVWDGNQLKPEIKEKLLEIAEAFLEFIDIEIDIEDITLTGSLANYNYTEYSDFDLHIITDLADYGVDKDLLKDYFKAKKTVWNSSHDITIKGYEVECYIQDIDEAHHSTGVYSLKNDEWVIAPEKIGAVDTAHVQQKVIDMKELIDYALSSECDLECAERAKEKVLKMRQIGLERTGEFSVENLAFKELRRTGDIDRLVQGVIAKKDEELSLRQEGTSLKQMFGLDTRERGPRHTKLNAGVGKLTNPNVKSVGMVAKRYTQKETPFPEIERLKAKKKGIEFVVPYKAQQIAAFYDLDLETIKKQPRGLSTSGIKISFNPATGRYQLTK